MARAFDAQRTGLRNSPATTCDDCGFDAKGAATAQQALALVEQDDSIALVFSDILMPGRLNGPNVAKELRQRFTGLPVLLTTGYSSSAQEAVRDGFEVLQNPTIWPRWNAPCFPFSSGKAMPRQYRYGIRSQWSSRSQGKRNVIFSPAAAAAVFQAINCLA